MRSRVSGWLFPSGRGSLCLFVVVGFLSLGMAGCSYLGLDGWLGGGKGTVPLAGQRVAVLPPPDRVRADPDLIGTPVDVPPAEEGADWPFAGRSADHGGGNLALAQAPRPVWRRDVGAGSDRSALVPASPIVAGGRVFVLDAEFVVHAVDAASGRKLWQRSLEPDNKGAPGTDGGLAFAGGVLFAATGFAELLGLDPVAGQIIRRHRLPMPARSSPVVAGGRVFVITLDNALLALSMTDGSRLWTYPAITEIAGLLGGASPAVDGNIVVGAFSSGEVAAIRAESGRAAWSDSLGTNRRIGELSQLADIIGLPVISRGLVLAVSHSGRMVAIDLRSGARAWEQEFGGTQSPWVAGDMVYVLTGSGELLAVTRRDGRVRWARSLDSASRPARLQTWVGPVMAGGLLRVVSSQGNVLAIDPMGGETKDSFNLSVPVRLAPIVAGGTLYILTEDAELIALR